MKNYKLTFALAVMAIMSATTVWAGSADTLTVRIKGMRCGECAHKVKTVVKKGPGIESIDFNLERRTATIAYDPAQTCADSIKAHLDATGRYKASAYSPNDTILRGFGLRIDDMHCQNCYNRISQRLQTMEGIDSMAPHLDKHYIFVRYDANQTCKADIRRVLGGLGFTPVNYYSSPKVAFAYYNIPAEAAVEATIDEVLTLTGVEDANVNAKRKSLAVTYFTDETTADALLEAIKAAGIEAVVPPAHVCKEEQKTL
ncbi:MAG: cation transporter [Prevotella sp.]|nr:cation transporter [Prevotella sp.]